MTDKSEPPVLADLMALKIDGPALVFIRPRRRLSADEMCDVADGLKLVVSKTPLGDGHFLLVPHDFDIMAIGDVELERYGLTRLPTVEAV